ncbi:MAG: DMT family transporter [Planctomycetota bacterium]
MPSPLRVHLALLTVSLLFGAHFVFTKQVLGRVPANSWVFFRMAAATLVMVPIALLLRRRRTRPSGRALLWLLLASFFGIALNQVLFTEGLVRTSPDHSAVVNSCIPTWTMLVAVLCGQERLRPRQLLAVVSALSGVLYLLGLDDMLWGDGTAFTEQTLIGDVLTAANGLVFAVHLVIMRHIGKTHTLDPWTSTAILFVQGTLLIGLWSAPTMAQAHLDAALMTPTVWFALYTVLAATVLTYLLNTWALRHTHSSNVALYINVQPIVAAALNTAMGQPAPGHRFYVALLLVAGGLWLQAGGGGRRSAP